MVQSIIPPIDLNRPDVARLKRGQGTLLYGDRSVVAKKDRSRLTPAMQYPARPLIDASS